MRNSPTVVLLACLSLMLTAPTYAQIEEITVTAERRSENLQEVPIAVTALTAETIEKKRVQGLSDIAALTPNFVIGQQSPTQPELTLRGIGSTDREAGSDRSVVIFVDEVYIGRAGASTFDLFDLERIEVLRGPQGTLYGRNVVGGAINLISAKPSQDFRTKIQLGTGSDGLFEFKGLVNGGLGQDLSAKLAVSIKERDGFSNFLEFDPTDAAAGTRTITGSKNSGATNSQSLRGQVYYQPENGFDALVTLEYSKDEVDGVPSQISQGAATVAAYGAALAPFYLPGHSQAGSVPPPPFTVENNVFGKIDRDSFAISAKINQETNYGTWTLIPAWRKNDLYEFRDIAGIKIFGNGSGRPKGFDSTAINDEKYQAASVELRLASAEKNTLNWIAGIYYLDEKIDRAQIRSRQANHGNSRPLFDQLINATSFAVFGQFTWSILEKLDLTVGGRYTEDEKTFDMAVVNTLTAAQQAAIKAICNAPAADGTPSTVCQAATLNPALSEFTANSKRSWSKFTPRFVLDFQATEDLLLYVSYSEGFKSGGYNGLAPTKQLAELSFKPETVKNWEVGVKASLFENKLQANLNYFIMDFVDLQLRSRVVPAVNAAGARQSASAFVTTLNVGEAEISGFEFELLFKPIQNFSVSASVSTLTTEVVKYDPGPLTAVFEGLPAPANDTHRNLLPTTLFLQPGSHLPRSPELNWNIGAEYVIPMGPGELELAGGVYYTHSLYYDVNEPATSLEPSHALFNARITWAAHNNWSVSLWGKNLGDKTYRSHVQAIRAGRAAVTQYANPMTWGATFQMEFGN